MKTTRLREEMEKLQTLLDYLEENNIEDVETQQNTYWVSGNFMQIGYEGFLAYESLAHNIEDYGNLEGEWDDEDEEWEEE